MKQVDITIPKTARYFISGTISEKTKYVWFVCHGYAQLANFFLKKFESLNTEEHVIIAPEGLHRFYWEGFGGRVVASWMTKEDRLSDINDYVYFLNEVYSSVLEQNNNVQVNVLGFSQGAATVCRWIANGKIKVNNLILWAGVFPPDLDFKTSSTFASKMNYLVIGDEDEFIQANDIEKQVAFLQENKIEHKLVKFKGKHEIQSETLLKLVNDFIKQ